MSDSRLSSGVKVVGTIALAFGLIHVALAAIGILSTPRSASIFLRLIAQLLLGLVLIVASPGIILQMRWGQLAGIAGFVGLTIVQGAPFVLRGSLVIPVLPMGISLLSGLYLIFASKEFRQNSRRPVPPPRR